MERTSARHENPRHRKRRLLIYGLGFILLTNTLTVVFVFVMRSPGLRSGLRSIAVLPGATAAAGTTAAGRAEKRQARTRKVRVTSRPDGAVVWYQGRVHGTTPLTIVLPATEAGELRLEKDGYQPRSITVSPDDTRVRVRLQHEPMQKAARVSQPGTALTSTAAPVAPGPTPGAAPAASKTTAAAPQGAAPTSTSRQPDARTDAATAEATPSGRRRLRRQKPASPAPVSENPDPWVDERQPAGATENPDPWAE